MAAVSVTPDDLSPFADIDAVKAEAMIADAMALAAVVAPCVLDEDFAHEAAAKAIIRAAILRWHDAGSGALQQQQTGPFGVTVDTRSPRKGMFWPSEITDLQKLCQASGSGGAFAIDTVGFGTPAHTASCDLYFGGADCSCGAVLTGAEPLWGI